jgi:hypothetical protein
VHFKAVGSAMHAALSALAGPLQLEGKGTGSNGAPPELSRHRAFSAPAVGNSSPCVRQRTAHLPRSAHKDCYDRWPQNRLIWFFLNQTRLLQSP